MPLFDLEDPETGNIITVEHPQAPTQEEALVAIQESRASRLNQPTQTMGEKELAAGLLGGTGVPIKDPVERDRLARRRAVARAQMEGEGGEFKIVNPGTIDESLQATISNDRFQAPSHIDTFMKDYGRLLPFSNANDEFYEGVRNGIQIGGDGIIGRAIGTGLGTARGVATALNPIAGLIGEVPKVVQAGGSAAMGDIDSALGSLGGKIPVTSSLEIPSVETGSVNLDTLINGLTGTANEAVIKQPLAPLGFTKGAMADVGGAFRSVGSDLASAARVVPEVARTVKTKAGQAVRGETPVDPAAVEAAAKKVQDLEFLREQNRINKTKTAEVRNADDLILQEELARAKAEADALSAEAMKANQELGPLIADLTKKAEEAPAYAEDIRGKLPQPEQPSQFGRSMQEGIFSSKQKNMKDVAEEDYSAVQESLGDSQPKFEGPALEKAAQEVAQEKGKGFSADFKSDIRSRLSEVLPKKKVDPLSGMSEQVRDIYENLPDSQKQNFLDQAGIDLKATVPRKYTWDELQEMYKGLNARIEVAKKNFPGDVRALQKLKKGVQDTMASYAEQAGTNTKALFDEANARYAANAEKFGTSRIENLVKDVATDTPETIVNKIVGDGRASVVNNLKEILPGEKFQQVQSQYADRLMSPSKGVKFDPDHFVKQFDSINNETLQAVFGEEGFAQLQKIRELSGAAEQAKVYKSQLDEYNAKAQKSIDAYARAKTVAEEKAIVDAARAEAESALDAIKDEKFQRDIEKARADLKKAQTPEKVRLITRLLYGLLSAAGVALSGGAGTPAIAAGLAAATFGRMIHRNVGSKIAEAVIKKK